MGPISRTDPTARAAVRARQAAELVPVLLRAVRWTPILLTGGLAFVALALLKQSPEGLDLVPGLRWSAVLLCVGGAFLLDDPAASVVATVPAPLPYRRVLRLALGLIVIGTVWSGLVWYATGSARAIWGGEVAPGFEFPMLRFTTELGAFLLATLLSAVVASRIAGDDRGGYAAGPALLVVVILLSKLPHRWALLIGPGDPRWADSTRDLRLGVTGLALALALLSLDPARRGIAARVRDARGR